MVVAVVEQVVDDHWSEKACTAVMYYYNGDVVASALSNDLDQIR